MKNGYRDPENEIKGTNKVFTHGSLMGKKKAGCAVYSEESTLKAKLREGTSIFTADLYAIYIKLLFTRDKPEQCSILSDSSSALKASENPHQSKHHLLI